MKIVSGIIMLIGAFITAMEFLSSTTSPQQAASVVYVVGAYVTGRALENFVSNSAKTEETQETVASQQHIEEMNEPNQVVSIELPDEYDTITIKHINGKPETISRKQWHTIISKHGDENYIVLDYQINK